MSNTLHRASIIFFLFTAGLFWLIVVRPGGVDQYSDALGLGIVTMIRLSPKILALISLFLFIGSNQNRIPYRTLHALYVPSLALGWFFTLTMWPPMIIKTFPDAIGHLLFFLL